MPRTPLDATIRTDSAVLVGRGHLSVNFLAAIADELYSERNISDAAAALGSARASGDGTGMFVAQHLHTALRAGVMLQNKHDTGYREVTGQTTALQNAIDGLLPRATAVPGAISTEAAGMSAETAAFAARLKQTARVAGAMADAAAAGR